MVPKNDKQGDDDKCEKGILDQKIENHSDGNPEQDKAGYFFHAESPPALFLLISICPLSFHDDRVNGNRRNFLFHFRGKKGIMFVKVIRAICQKEVCR